MGKPRKALPQTKTRHPQLDSITELGTKAEKLEAQGDRTGAVQAYRDWLSVNSNSQVRWIAHFNLGVLLRGIGDTNGAAEAYQAAIFAHPKQPHARVNLGTTLEALGRPNEAIEQWEMALTLLDETPKADVALKCTVLNNLGRILEVLQRYTAAEEMLTRSLLLNPKQEAVLYHRIYLRQKQCEWPIYGPLPGITLEDQMKATSAVAMLSISDDPQLQLDTALSQVPGKIPQDLPKLANAQGYSHDRLRIGYLSSNFGMHAVSILTAELYELHDRSRVEVWGFCWSPEDNTEMRERVIQAMDHFIRINSLSDEEAAQAIRAAEIDILIDLQGLTAGCRPKVLAYRPAPVQITYLGFPGTTGLPEIDYVIADRYIIPEQSAKYFTEKPLYLPNCFQVNDRKRIASPPLSRKEYGLPEGTFVFCAFNNNIKFTPEFFSCWMRILQRTPNSVLWLLADNERARSNLGQLAEEHGLDLGRLIFSPRVPVADYLGRFAAADLFLDLFPFNGGTTVADALWMGLPVVTLSGRSFASRMAGSLLNAIGLPELITTSLEAYEDLAVALAHDPARVVRLRARALVNKDTHPLFDTPKLVRDLEDLYLKVAHHTPNTAEITDGKRTPRPAGHLNGSQGISPHKIRLLVYTVLIGDKEQLNDPLRLIGKGTSADIDIQYICFTDRLSQSSPTWQMRELAHPLIPMEKLSRLPKAQPHLFFPDHDYSLYIDNTVVFKRLPCHNDLGSAVFRAFRHPWRTNPIDEADIVAKNGLDTISIIAEQFRHYEASTDIKKIGTLTAGTVLLRQHHHPLAKRFGELWWEQILLFSKRDQLSLDLCANVADCPIEHFPGDKRNNDLFHWPALPTGRRVLGSFDGEYYAWVHRNVPAAAQNPRLHYLSSTYEGDRYARHYPWFEYLCDRVGSSLGKVAMPRRDIAYIIDGLIKGESVAIKKILLIGSKSTTTQSVEPIELERAATALTRYFRFSTQPKIVTTIVTEAAIEEKAPFHAANGVNAFDLAIVLGLPARQHADALTLFTPLIAHHGSLLLQFTDSLKLHEISSMHSSIGAKGTLNIFHGRHPDYSEPMPNSIILLSLSEQTTL